MGGGVAKTLYYNFKLFPIRQAVFLPLIVGSKTIIHATHRGAIEFSAARLHPGMLLFGVSHLDCSFPAPNFIKIEGKLIIHGSGFHKFGPGGNLTIGPAGILEIGNNFSIGHFSKFVISAHSTIGDNNMHSWENLYMDTDCHPIFNESGIPINYPKGFHIGNDVWIGARCTILKGVKIANGVILASRSLVSKDLNSEYSIYASSRMIKSNVRWCNDIL